MTRLDVETTPVKKGYKYESSARLKFRTASLAAGNELATHLRDAAFLKVIVGKEGSVGKDHYKYDTSIDLTLPDQKVESPSLEIIKPTETKVVVPSTQTAPDSNPSVEAPKTTGESPSTPHVEPPKTNAPIGQPESAKSHEAGTPSPAPELPAAQTPHSAAGLPTTQPARNGGRP